MTAFQLDEGFNYKPLIRSCEAEGKCEIRPWPEEMRGKKDWEWFPKILSLDAPVVCKDFTIALEEQNRRSIPDNSSGLIVVRPKERQRPFKASHAAQIVATFKKHFPRWHKTDWRDVYIEIRDDFVEVNSIKTCHRETGCKIQMDDADFVTKLDAAIASARSPS